MKLLLVKKLPAPCDFAGHAHTVQPNAPRLKRRMSKTALQKAQGEAQRKARKQRDFSKVFTLPNVSQQTPVQTAPDGLKLQLFGYQLRSLSRMCGIEGDGMISLPTGSSGSAECHFRGGVIADVVGMGKTAQLIALFLARPYGEQDRLNGRRGNLVITPGHLCTQWAEEVAKFAGSALSVKIVDPERAPPSSVNLQNFDVVITSLEYISGAGYQELYGHWKRIVYDECHEVRAPRWAGNCHFRLLSALHAHTTTPYKTDLLFTMAVDLESTIVWEINASVLVVGPPNGGHPQTVGVI